MRDVRGSVRRVFNPSDETTIQVGTIAVAANQAARLLSLVVWLLPIQIRAASVGWQVFAKQCAICGMLAA